MSENQNEIECASVRPGRRTSVVAFSEVVVEDDPLLRFDAYLHAVPRRNSITPEKQRAFVAALAATGIVTQAARSIGVSLESLYKLRHRAGAEGFSAAWDAALDRGFSRLEDCALERAIAGEERPIVRGGEVVGTWRRYDTALLLFLLRQRRGQRWAAVGTHYASLRPGHPVYERLRGEWEAQDAADSQAVYDSIDAMIDRMRENSIANAALLAEDEPDEEDEDAARD